MDNTYYLTTSAITPYALWYSVIPPPALVGSLQQYPFTINLSASDTNPHIIDLYAQYSNSTPNGLQNKWSHLIPQWRFTDINGNIINSVTTTDTPIMSGNEIVGVTGSAQFYFIDDISSQLGNPDIIWATLSISELPYYSESKDGNNPIPSYSNSKVVVALPYYINGMAPKELQITRNGKDSMSDGAYWINQNIPNLVTINGNTHSEFGCVTEGLGILYDYPSSNQLGLDMGTIDMGITTIPASAQTWTTLDDLDGPYFQKYDKTMFRRGGYSRNMVNSKEITLNTTITAGVEVLYNTYKHTPYVWISNPDNNLLYKFDYQYYNPTIVNNITSWLDGFDNMGHKHQFNTEYLTARSEPMSLSGFGGIYGIAIDPCFNVWASDAELDKIYKFNHLGVMVTSIDLNDSGVTPAGIALDSKNNLWVSLFDSASVLKYDGTTGALLTTINPQGNQDPIVNGFGVDPDYKPTIVQTDKNDNIWVSFTNSLCSTLNKYDKNGTSLNISVVLPLCSNPMDLLVTSENNVWVTLTYHSTLSGGSVNQYDSIGTQLSSISAYHPEYLTLDNNNQLYFTSDYNKVNKVDLNTGNITTSAYGISASPNWYGNQLNYNALEGIAADSSNRIWIINSMESLVYVISGDMMLTTYELPTNRPQFIVGTDFTQLTAQNPYEKSIQAFGDWTGLRWYQKYISTEQIYLTGQSDLFDIDSFEGYDLRKFNESWDATTQMRDYALTDSMHNNVNLFENYLGTMIGGLETSANSMGRKVYEKVANFVANNGDVDVCGVNQLYSLAKSVDVPIDDYNFHMPSELQRLVDILSIDHKRLWGDRCKCSSNYRGSWGYCEKCGHKHDSNRGNNIDGETYILSAGVPILAEYKYDRNYYEKITKPTTPVTLLSAITSYDTNFPYTNIVSTYNLYNVVLGSIV